MTKNMTGPFLYTVNGRSVTKTINGKPYTGRYDGKGKIWWPAHRNLPNGGSWKKQGMIESLIVFQ